MHGAQPFANPCTHVSTALFDTCYLDAVNTQRKTRNPDPLRIKEPSAVSIPLFKCRYGPVRAEIHGPPKGWKWKVIKYYRLVQSTRGQAGKWIRVDPDRPADQKNLLRCVKAVVDWLDENENK